MLSDFLVEFNIEYFVKTSECYIDRKFVGIISESNGYYIFDPCIKEDSNIVNLRLDLPQEYLNLIIREIRDKIRYLNLKDMPITKSTLYRFVKAHKSMISHVFHPITKLQNGCGISMKHSGVKMESMEIRLNKFLTIKMERKCTIQQQTSIS